MKQICLPYFKYKEDVSLLHIGHVRYLLILHPDKFTYIEKSLMVYKIEACNLKFFRLTESYVCTLFFHTSFRSLIKSHRYISISLLDVFRFRINNDINGSFMHFQDDTLYDISITGYMLQEVLKLPKRLNPSVARSNRILCRSLTKCRCFASKSFCISESIEWLNMFSFETRCS